MKRLGAALFLAAAVLLPAGCDKLTGTGRTPFNGIDVTGGDMGGELRLEDPEGKTRTLADFRGKVVTVVFGYTNCPDVCPTSLADMAKAVRELGDAGAGVQVLFVTVDPKRDNPEVMRQYAAAFHPSFIGLRGDEAATAKVAKDFRVYANAREGKAGGSYTVDHSGQMFVLDRAGRVRLVLPPGMAPALIASDLRVLLAS